MWKFLPGFYLRSLELLLTTALKFMSNIVSYTSLPSFLQGPRLRRAQTPVEFLFPTFVELILTSNPAFPCNLPL